MTQGTPMTKQQTAATGSDRSDRRQQILEAARRCFKVQGFHRTTLRDIAREFGMSVGHIYNYFSNKEAIIEALVETQTQSFIDMLDSEKFNHLPPEERLYHELGAVVDAYLDLDSAQLTVAIISEAMVNPKVYEIAVAASAKVREHITNAYYGRFGEDREYAPPQVVMETRIITMRAMLEGLRYTRLFNPNADQKVLRDMTIRRLMLIFESERQEDLARIEAMKAKAKAS